MNRFPSCVRAGFGAVAMTLLAAVWLLMSGIALGGSPGQADRSGPAVPPSVHAAALPVPHVQVQFEFKAGSPLLRRAPRTRDPAVRWVAAPPLEANRLCNAVPPLVR
jgi:hypothetical protein